MTSPTQRSFGLCLLASVAGLWGCAGTPNPAAAPSEATVAAHVQAATKAAGTDLGEVLTLCKAAPATRAGQEDMDRGLLALINKPAPPPGQAFDKLYFVGGDWASAWAIDTSEGIILIDALNNPAEAAALIEGGLRKQGLDPARIRYIIVSHGHGDHYGGAPYLAQKYGARVVMSDVDWTMTETRLELATPIWGAPPKRDISVKDGDRITLGGTTVTLYLTPGHSWGTLSPVFDVAWQGQKHRVLLWGGTGFNFGKDIPRLEAYSDSAQRMAGIARSQGIDVMLSNHSRVDGSQAKLAKLRQDARAPANPFVVGLPTVERTLTVMNECALAQRDRFALMP
ncbi:MBL fold metallo-hydrolase [Variovorax saccharolyticus]|uniref:MBL fold metallo-hydrolase n=1 Tax=Variovorax saccharolyticus TaxID=3053516 RepID=UPI0025753D88|nr:MBL fold metallo-hydrolase [Variovorax sp. J22R187]MDM0018928.1 MBL fold metallo-hydrolase [Variovorax sp. J22R187]